MTLRLKAVIAVLVALVASAALLYGVSRVILIHEMVAIESNQMRKDVSVATKAIDRDWASLTQGSSTTLHGTTRMNSSGNPARTILMPTSRTTYTHRLRSICLPLFDPMARSPTADYST